MIYRKSLWSVTDTQFTPITSMCKSHISKTKVDEQDTEPKTHACLEGYLMRSRGSASQQLRKTVVIWGFFCFFVFCFLGPHPQHMEVPRLEVKSELQPPAYTVATQDWRHICKLHHSSRQHQIPDPLIKARDWTCILMDTSRIHFHWLMMGPPRQIIID